MTIFSPCHQNRRANETKIEEKKKNKFKHTQSDHHFGIQVFGDIFVFVVFPVARRERKRDFKSSRNVNTIRRNLAKRTFWWHVLSDQITLRLPLRLMRSAHFSLGRKEFFFHNFQAKRLLDRPAHDLMRSFIVRVPRERCRSNRLLSYFDAENHLASI